VAHYVVGGWKVATTINMVIIFLIFGVTLDARELSEAARAGKALTLGASSILFLTPLTALIASRLPFQPREFALGLAVMACAPTSLSSGVTLVAQGYGSGALALLLTVSTNVLGIATSPLMVQLALAGLPFPSVVGVEGAEEGTAEGGVVAATSAGTTPPPPPHLAPSSASSHHQPQPQHGHHQQSNGGGGGGAHVDAADLLVKLGTSILAPLVLGKLLRETLPPYFRRTLVPKSKPFLYLTNNLQISMIVWQKISAARPVLVEQELGAVALAVLAAVGWHFLLLACNILACRAARLPEAERKAVVVMASQKNLPTAAAIISYFDPRTVGNSGLMTVPCVAWYVSQLFVDAYLANVWAGKFESRKALEREYAAELAAVGVVVGGGGVVATASARLLPAGAVDSAAAGPAGPTLRRRSSATGEGRSPWQQTQTQQMQQQKRPAPRAADGGGGGDDPGSVL